jgi:hypothetical protein
MAVVGLLTSPINRDNIPPVMRSFVLLCCLFALRLSILGQPCPAGQQGDHYPGKCGIYQDTNRDSLCDLSQPALGAGEAGSPSQTSLPPPASRGPRYHLLEFALAVALLAAATEVALARRRSLTHRLQALWNWLLLVSFLLAALTGLYFVIPVAIRPRTSINVSLWHTEASLLFIAVGIYHAIRRFASMLRGLGVFWDKR